MEQHYIKGYDTSVERMKELIDMHPKVPLIIGENCTREEWYDVSEYIIAHIPNGQECICEEVNKFK